MYVDKEVLAVLIHVPPVLDQAIKVGKKIWVRYSDTIDPSIAYFSDKPYLTLQYKVEGDMWRIMGATKNPFVNYGSVPDAEKK